ncbi:hypothetical protein AAZX31_19G014200 [Glycine max]
MIFIYKKLRFLSQTEKMEEDTKAVIFIYKKLQFLSLTGISIYILMQRLSIFVA